MLCKEKRRQLAGVTFTSLSPSENTTDFTPDKIIFFFSFFGLLKKKL
jgi:hypothetical protein